MLKSKPVIASDAKPLQRIINETNCGYTFKACNSKNLAELLLYINEHRNELCNKALNGFNAVKNKYNWEKEDIKFINIIKKVIMENIKM